MYKYRSLLFLLGFIILSHSCKKDDGRSCVSCTSSQTPTFEVCEESDGNASVNGQDTGTSYSVYIAGLEAVGTSCGG